MILSVILKKMHSWYQKVQNVKTVVIVFHFCTALIVLISITLYYK